MIIGATTRGGAPDDIFAASSGNDADETPSLLRGIPASAPAMRWLRQAVTHIAESDDVAAPTQALARDVAAGAAPLSRLITDAAFPEDASRIPRLLEEARATDLETAPNRKAHRWA